MDEMFSGNHHLLSQPFHPMVIRFFILQTHYSSTLDFSNDALMAAEKGLKRLWEAYENLRNLEFGIMSDECLDKELDTKCVKLINEFAEFMNDDFSTAKILANMFELTATINAIKNSQLPPNTISSNTLVLMQTQFKLFIEDILGLTSIQETTHTSFNGVMQLLINIRKEAKAKKDFVTSDKIRNELAALGINLKDEKDGGMSWVLS